MRTAPLIITDKEWKELTNVPEVVQAWGLDNDPKITLVEDFKAQVYGVKFDFVSGSPGYCGDLFILSGDSLGEPMTLIRDLNTKKLTVLQPEP